MTTQDQNSQPNPSRIDIIQTVKTPLGFFTLIVLLIEAFLGFVVVNLGEGADRTLVLKWMLLLLFLLVILVALLAFFRPEALSGKRPSININPAIKELNTRHLYLAAMIEQIDSAQKAIWLSVHTLNPSRTSQEVSALQNKLAKAKADGKDVRLLTPSGAERVEAAYELSKQRGIPIRVLTYLGVEDLRYMIIDNNLSIISLEASNDQGSSTVGAVINSEQLNGLLQKHFEQHWNNESAMNYDAFLSFEVRKLLNPYQPPSKTAIASNLGIPVSEIDRILRIQPAKVIFMIGRPGSGKTSAIQVIIDYLHATGYDSSQIAVHNDYRLLYKWFQEDQIQKNFEPGPKDGFRVKNFGILDDCLREINKAVVKDIVSKQFVIVEFSRKEYVSAFMDFDNQLLKSCTIFYLRASVKTCVKRNEGRVSQGNFEGVGFVPPDILETYYKEDDVEKLSEKFAENLIQIDNGQDGIALLNDKIKSEVSKKIGYWLLESTSNLETS